MSLRTRLLIGMAIVAAALVATGLLVRTATQRYLVNQVDDQLRGANIPVAPLLRAFTSGDDALLGLPSTYIGILARDSSTVLPIIVPTESGRELAAPEVDAQELARHEDDPFTVESEDGSARYRVAAIASTEFGELTEGFGGFVVVFGISLDEVDSVMDRLVWIELIGLAVVLTILAVVTWWMLRLGLRPLRQMTDAAGVIAGGDLSHRLPDAVRGTEAATLGRALNVMLTSVQASFDEQARSEDRLRRFIADASHELRTPITTIRGYEELYRRGVLASPDAVAEAHRRTEEEAARMGALVDDLLTLAELGERPQATELVDLSAIAIDAAADARAVDPSRTVTVDVVPGVEVVGDENRLRQAAGNLVRNAVVHTPAGTPVEVSVTVDTDDPDSASFAVADHGPGMDEVTAQRAFERFYRADVARSRERGGSGLGLSIVKAVVAAHGGTVSIGRPADSGTVVGFRLPRSSRTSVSFTGDPNDPV
jgi:two-component system, OmpR family, sensor kinase